MLKQKVRVWAILFLLGAVTSYILHWLSSNVTETSRLQNVAVVFMLQFLLVVKQCDNE